jgi:nicotinate-nucleotide pyrophosphorylase (carboxylating)
MKHGMVERTPGPRLVNRHAELEDASCPVAIDLAVFTLAGRELSVLLVQRSEPPYPGFWALPGRLHLPGESLDAQARLLHQGITGLEGGWIEQLKTFHRPQQTDASGQIVVPGRDPRGDVISVAYIAIVPTAQAESCAGRKNGAEQEWHPVRRLPVEMAFDHREIVDYAVRRLRSKVGYSSLGFQLLPSEFTISELQHVYERCWDSPSIAGTSGARSWTAASSSRPERNAASAASARISSASPSRRSVCGRSPMVSSKPELEVIVATALREDLGSSDVTTRYIVDADLMGEAVIVAKSDGVLSGEEAAAQVFRITWPSCEYVAIVPDGTRLHRGDIAAKIVGPLASILTGERTALNFLQRLSGVATLTRRYADALAPYKHVTLLDTRKTTPGLRFLERAAVRAGGGHNHRAGLFDAILIKDNHVAAAGGVGEAVRRARGAGLPIEVEVDTLAQLDEALDVGAEIVLLDNMSPDEMRRAVEKTAGRALLEASGGMTLEGAVAAAQAGVDRISVGALTHSAPALDLSLEVTRTWR